MPDSNRVRFFELSAWPVATAPGSDVTLRTSILPMKLHQYSNSDEVSCVLLLGSVLKVLNNWSYSSQRQGREIIDRMNRITRPTSVPLFGFHLVNPVNPVDDFGPWRLVEPYD